MAVDRMLEAEATFRGQLIIIIHGNEGKTNSLGCVLYWVNAVVSVRCTRWQLMIMAGSDRQA
jgi:hypothetical protein